MSARFVLYDLPSRAPNKCWSLNPWKTRLLLNYKNLPYETRWVEYPDIKPTFEEHVGANKEGAEYTIPTVKFPDGSYMQDSREIANRIEKENPYPQLHMNSEILVKVEALMKPLMAAAAPDYIPKVPKRLLNEASLPYWYETREKRFNGMPLDQVEREKGGDTAWRNAAPIMQEITGLLKAKEGPYFEGNHVTYVDFVWAGFWRFMQRIGDDILDRALEASGDRELHQAHLRACDPWLVRDDH